jgi:hypothetical protein
MVVNAHRARLVITIAIILLALNNLFLMQHNALKEWSSVSPSIRSPDTFFDANVVSNDMQLPRPKKVHEKDGHDSSMTTHTFPTMHSHAASLDNSNDTKINSINNHIGKAYHQKKTTGTSQEQDPIRSSNPKSSKTSLDRSPIVLSKNSSEFNATIVVQLSGMMGNIIGKIAHGYGLKWRLKEDHGMRSDLWLHQNRDKWQLRARKSLQKCFQFASGLEFEHDGNREECNAKMTLQESWFGKNPYGGIISSDESVSLALEEFINDTQIPRVGTTRTSNATIASGTNDTISLPFLHSNFMVHIEFDKGSRSFIQRYYHKFREFFRFDFEEPTCCNPQTRPDPDESVFHFRNFKKELNNPKQSRFPELGPNQIAQEIFRHLNPGDKVAIISRFADKYVQLHVKALERRGLNVRVIEGNSGEQDFCFLLSAEKEILGSDKSTFFFWAAVLGNAQKVRLHSIGADYRYSSYEHPPELKKRFLFSNHDVNATLDPGWR